LTEARVQHPQGGRNWRSAAVGFASAGAAVLFQGLLHLAVPGAPFAPFSIAEFVVRHVSGSLATSAIELLGHQALLLVGTLSILSALGLGFVLWRLSPWALALASLLLTLGAALLDPMHPHVLLATVAGLVAGGAALSMSFLLAGRLGGRIPFDARRRRLLAGAVWGLGAMALAGGTLWRLLRPLSAGSVSADLPLQPIPDPSFDAITGLSPLVTSPQAHYVVDINLDTPIVSEQAWRLFLHGVVGHPLALTLEDLRGMFTVEHLVNMSCISNTVGGPLVGNALWTGVSLTDLLDRARPTANARMLKARGADGYYDTMPLDVARQPDVLVAFGMDDQVLPSAHGFPTRLLIPGHYGFKSVKWLQELEVLTTFPLGYWEQRGWDPDGIIRTESRFDVPVDHSQVRSPFSAAGVAWAGTRGVSRVEVSIDDGHSWRAAELEQVADTPAWRRWKITLELLAGVYPLTVRAIDGTGRVQDATYRPPHPSGASGYHRIVVTVQD
jgi:DMSO/TMAO reductase YedYZ molybdopterin-dependent catalytic subunit